MNPNGHYVIKGLVTNYGEWGGYKMGGGHVKFYPYEKGGDIFLAMLKEVHKRFWGRFYAVA